MIHPVTYRTTLHVHEFFEIVYVKKGTLLHRYGPGVHTVRAGDLFIVNPTVPHGYDLTPDGPAEIWNVILTESALNMLTLEADTSLMIGELMGHERNAFAYRCLHLSQSVRTKIERIIGEMAREYRDKEKGYQVILKGHLFALVGLIGRAFNESGLTIQPVSSSQSKLGELTNYVMDHCNQPLSVKQLAERFGWTPDHLSRLIKKMTGESLQELIGRIRAARAAQLLMTDNMTVDQVAKSVGYSDARAFRRAFKRYHGLSPSQFRKAAFKTEEE